MSCSQKIKPQNLRFFQETPEFKVAVAVNAGVRRPSPQILADKSGNYFFLELFGIIEDIVRDFEPVTDPLRIVDGSGSAAPDTIPFLSDTETHGDTGNVVSFIFHNHGRNGRIDPAAHGNQNSFTRFIQLLHPIESTIS